MSVSASELPRPAASRHVSETSRTSAFVALALAVVGAGLFWRLRYVLATESPVLNDRALVLNVLVPFLVLAAGCLLISLISILLTSRQERIIAQDRRRIETTEQVADLLESLDEEHTQNFSSWLHDSIGHGLVLLKMDLEHLVSAGRLVSADAANSIAHLDAMLAEVRGMASSLYPKIITDVGLAAALESLVSHYRAMTHLDVDSAIGALPALEMSRRRAFAVYRTVQECLTNAAKYGASFVWVSVQTREGRVHGTILNHAKAEDKVSPQNVEGVGIGLELMELRLRRIGGSLSRGWAEGGVFKVEFVA